MLIANDLYSAMIAAAVYLLGGIAYQRTVMHQRGWKQLPNYSTWAGIGNFLYVSKLSTHLDYIKKVPIQSINSNLQHINSPSPYFPPCRIHTPTSTNPNLLFSHNLGHTHNPNFLLRPSPPPTKRLQPTPQRSHRPPRTLRRRKPPHRPTR